MVDSQKSDRVGLVSGQIPRYRGTQLRTMPGLGSGGGVCVMSDLTDTLPWLSTGTPGSK